MGSAGGGPQLIPALSPPRWVRKELPAHSSTDVEILGLCHHLSSGPCFASVRTEKTVVMWEREVFAALIYIYFSAVYNNDCNTILVLQ